MQKVHVFQTVKGGVGCTTTAIGFSAWLANETQEKVTLIAMTNDDASVSLTSTWQHGVEYLDCIGHSEMYVRDLVSTLEGHVVIDAGNAKIDFPKDWNTHIVVDNKYLSLRQVTMVRDYKDEYDSFVVTMHPDSALTLNDCRLVLGLPLFISVNWSTKTGRGMDAGLFPRSGDIRAYYPNLVVA